VSMAFQNLHTYYNAGGTMGLGTHQLNSSSPPGTFQYNRYRVHDIHFDKGQTKSFSVSNDFGWWAVDGTFRGPVIFFNSSDPEYYGYYAKFPQVAIAYTK